MERKKQAKLALGVVVFVATCNKLCDDDSEPSTVASAASSGDAPQVAESGVSRLAGTWTGQLSTGDRSFDARLTITKDGFFSMPVQSLAGEQVFTPHEVGQVFKFRPPRGGAQIYQVVELVNEPNHARFSMSVTFVHASNGYSNENHSEESWELVAAGADEAQATYAFRGRVSMGDTDVRLAGASPTDLFKGTLRRER